MPKGVPYSGVTQADKLASLMENIQARLNEVQARERKVKELQKYIERHGLTGREVATVAYKMRLAEKAQRSDKPVKSKKPLKAAKKKTA